MFQPDFTSSTWKWLEKHIEERRKLLLESLSSPNMNMDETQLVRGQLLEIKELLFSAKKVAKLDFING